MRKLADSELPYAMAILDGLNNSSVLKEELKKYPKDIVNWLYAKDLLVACVFKVEDRSIETRVTLGIRAFLPGEYDNRLNILKAINNG